MATIELDPRVRRFQQIKAASKKAAIERKEAIAKIRQTTPILTEKQAGQILDAHNRLNSFEVRQFGESKRTVKVFKV